MQTSSIGALAPFSFLCAAFGSWSIVSLCFLIAFFFLQYKVQRQEQVPRLRLWIPAIVFAGLVIMTEAGVVVMWIVLGRDSHAFESNLFQLVGLARLDPWNSDASVFLSLLPQVAAAMMAMSALYHEKHDLPGRSHHSLWGKLLQQDCCTSRQKLMTLVSVAQTFTS
jgi:hypothetical protein